MKINFYIIFKIYGSTKNPPISIFKSFFSYDGRIGRLDFFIQFILLDLVSIIFFVPSFLLIFLTYNEILSLLFLYGGGLLSIIFFIIGIISLHVRRWHDLNITGKATWLNFIPYIGILYTLYLFFAKGTNGDNKYGPNPLNPENNLSKIPRNMRKIKCPSCATECNETDLDCPACGEQF